MKCRLLFLPKNFLRKITLTSRFFRFWTLVTGKQITSFDPFFSFSSATHQQYLSILFLRAFCSHQLSSGTSNMVLFERFWYTCFLKYRLPTNFFAISTIFSDVCVISFTSGENSDILRLRFRSIVKPLPHNIQIRIESRMKFPLVFRI